MKAQTGSTSSKNVRPLAERSMVFQVAYQRFLAGRADSKVRQEAFRAGWAAHNKARSGTKRPRWAERSVATQSVFIANPPIGSLL